MNSGTGYLVDDIRINDLLNNNLPFGINKNAIEEIKLLTGVFDAEYGNATGEIVDIKLKSGSKKAFVVLESQNDEFLGNGTKGLRSSGTSIPSLNFKVDLK